MRCDTRAACCMLCVTITMVKRLLELVDQLLDLRRVEIGIERRGRFVEQYHLGPYRNPLERCIAAAAAPRTGESALWWSLSLTSSHSAAWRSASSTWSSTSDSRSRS